MSSKKVLSAITDSVAGISKSMPVYEHPIEYGSQKIIPVSSTRFAGGGGGGESQAGNGIGYGGHLSKHPVGYIHMQDGKTTFVPIIDKQTKIKAILFTLLALIYFLMRFISR